MEPTHHRPFKNQWLNAFLVFLQYVKIPSKEFADGPAPITLYDSQMRFLREIDEGLIEEQHFFVTLKSRQLGMTTVMLAMDLFFLYLKPGLQGALIADTDDNRITFRDTFTTILDNLPAGFRIPIAKHNRTALVLENGSRLQYMSAGKKANNPDLGRSRGLNFVHASECSGWGDQNGILSLKDSLATDNPNRLYIFESTAKGYNVFYDMYREALEDPEQRAMFIGWWAKPLNSIRSGTAEFERWWGLQPALTEQEAAMAHLIYQDYDHTMTPEQWAWWRKMTFSRSEQNLLQEHPWHADVAFQVTGSPFFSLKRLGDDLALIRGGGVTFDGYKYIVGESFLTLKCEQVYTPAEAELKVWEAPVKNARYVIGVDVAYGRNPNNDRHAICIFRCYADKLVQVAEWATNMPETRVVAWVMAHLAGSYRDCMINLEVSGPGLTVMTEMKTLRQDIQYAHLKSLEPVFNSKDALDMARWFLYHRPDTPGQGYVLNWKTNHDNKLEMFNGFRDAYANEQVILRSADLISEMVTLVQDGTSIQASARNKDDRPFAAGLACHSWRHWIRLNMMQDGRTYAVESKRQEEYTAAGGKVVSGIIPQFFQRMERERQDENLRRLLEM